MAWFWRRRPTDHGQAAEPAPVTPTDTAQTRPTPAGGLVFLFGLLMLMVIVLIALAVIAAIRRGGKNFATRFSRVTYRA